MTLEGMTSSFFWTRGVDRFHLEVGIGDGEVKQALWYGEWKMDGDALHVAMHCRGEEMQGGQDSSRSVDMCGLFWKRLEECGGGHFGSWLFFRHLVQ